MTPEEMESNFQRFFEISADLQRKQLQHQEEIADLIESGRRIDRRIERNTNDIRDLLEIVRAQERRIQRLEGDVEPQGRISEAFDRVYQDIDGLEVRVDEMNGKLDAILRRLTGEN
jgi:hypothetical protein